MSLLEKGFGRRLLFSPILNESYAMPGKAAKVIVSEKQQAILNKFAKSKSCKVSLAQRSRIILLAFEGHNNEAIEREVGLQHDAVGVWRRRWRDDWQRLISIECSEKPHVLEQEIKRLLADLPRAGRKPTITAQQQATVFKKACEDPKDSDRPIAKWSHRELSLQLIADGVFDAISGRWIGKLLRRASIRPHKNKYWLTSKDKTDPDFDRRVAEVCAAYHNAIALYESRGIHTICIDEQTGIQALQRIAPDLLPRPGMTMLREYEYIRHGTLCLFGNLHVPTGKILCPMLRQTRTEEDYLENIDAVIGQDPDAGYRLIADNLNTHSSESCVRYVATSCGIEEDLGKKGVRGILKSVASRAAFLTAPSHRIQFLFTPRHCSWLNQIEIWFGTLRSKVTRWSSFHSVDALQTAIESFIEYFNETMAKPYNWTYTGKVLAA